MQLDVAIIGGTGVGSILTAMGGELVTIKTEAGTLEGLVISHENIKILLVQRHSLGHKTPPHLVNYKAIALGLKRAGVRGCFSTGAVGSLRPDWHAGTMAICSDFLDFSGRRLTLFSDEVVHTDFSEPFSEDLRGALIQAAKDNEVECEEEAVYACTDGPRYESPAEVKMYRQLGADVVGMTVASEAILCREAAVPYACLAIITNFASGLAGKQLSHSEVVHMMQMNGKKAVDILLSAAALVTSNGA